MASRKIFNTRSTTALAGVSYQNALNPTPSVVFTYDPYFPRIATMSDGTGTTNYSYVPVGKLGALQLAEESGPLPNDTITYAYDALGRVVSRAVGGADPETFAYDKIDRLVGHAGTLGKFALNYLGETEAPIGRRLVGGNVSTAWSYLSDADDRRLKSIMSAFGRTFNYSTTPEDLITNIVEEKAGKPLQSWSVGYDAANRLRAAASTSGAKYSYSLDPASNITASTGPSGTGAAAYNKVNELVQLGGKPLAYDRAGNLLSDGVRNYTWDAENRLIGITYRAHPGQGTSFLYDGFDRRVAITETSASGKKIATEYVWCGLRICASRDGRTGVERLYYGEGEAIPASKAFLYYGSDQLDLVRDVFAKSPVFSMVQEYDYDPYGNPTKAPTTGPTTDFRYAGMFYHADSGLYLTQYRAYDPRLGRWLSRDPAQEEGGPNLYPYVADDPVNELDPDGQKAGCKITGKVGPFEGGVDVDQNGKVTPVFKVGKDVHLGPIHIEPHWEPDPSCQKKPKPKHPKPKPRPHKPCKTSGSNNNNNNNNNNNGSDGNNNDGGPPPVWTYPPVVSSDGSSYPPPEFYANPPPGGFYIPPMSVPDPGPEPTTPSAAPPQTGVM